MQYGPGTDPVPYIAAAFALGGLAIFGFGLWLVKERLRLRLMLKAIKASGGQGHGKE